MPKQPSRKDVQLITNVQYSLENVSCTRQALSVGQVRSTETALTAVGDREYSDNAICNRWQSLLGPARAQTFGVCRAMASYLALGGYDKSAIAGILPNTANIGRQFGRLPSGELHGVLESGARPLSDVVALQEMAADPGGWFDLDHSDRLDFSGQAKERLRSAYNRRLGCSILNRTVVVAGQEANMYDVVWTTLVGQYVETQLSLPEIGWSE